MRTWVVTALLLFVACAAPPEQVFVPGEAFRHVVEVTTAQGIAAEVRVGEWLPLSGRRVTGPWVPVQRRSLPHDGCWVGGPPPEEEEQVADNLRWLVQPEGAAEFNVEYLHDHTRRVRFSAPGRYVVRAESTTWCAPGSTSNDLVVVVRD